MRWGLEDHTAPNCLTVDFSSVLFVGGGPLATSPHQTHPLVFYCFCVCVCDFVGGGQ